MSTFGKSKLNVLICTIGSNPLPIYVTTQYLMQENRNDVDELPKPDRLLFVHTKNTKHVFTNLKNKIGVLNRIIGIDLGGGERDRDEVMSKLTNELSKLEDSCGINSIHLFYTGGTKPMSVFSFLAVEEFARERNIRTIYSDLHPDYAQITVGRKVFPFSDGKDLRDYIHLTIKDLFELHNMQISQQGKSQMTFEQVDIIRFANRIIDIINDSSYSSWRDSLNKLKKVSEKKDLRREDIEKKRADYENVRKELKDVFPIHWSQASKSVKSFRETVEFLHGKWLEEYVIYAIEKIKSDVSLSEVRQGIEARYERRPCELDIVAMKGYQMYLFSCTTSSKIKTVKGKAFEALYRAEQLGGSHAKVVMVSMLPSKGKGMEGSESCNDNLEKDLASFNAQYEKKVSLIGREELKDFETLTQKLKDIFCS
ncbi:hypothetical protein B9L19_11435 [Geobacillus thermocatenulatus]|uniref:Card1 endonuclease domain-containing protein n=3 Tax=Geobacillus TaxID=129337 RepID=A0A226Q291_9BACL|nr:DUF1887 family CARF protein [Geobacillus thermocatenulatus]ASS99764.1 hypothetical protein GT3921_12465 [Geobacillus thermocatenulatus]OXB86158.1 hypothetical protein B9L19_11435 [Geobacillus thermocatenulatus]